MENVIRFGTSIEPDLLKEFDNLIKKKGYSNRSEAIRDIIRENLILDECSNPNTTSIGTLTMIYNHHIGNITDKLLKIQHEQNNDILVTTHIHIDHNNCLEILVLRGKTGKILKLAEKIKALKGIKHGKVVITNQSI